MLARQLVLVAVDYATNVERTVDVARGVAKMRGADLHVVQVVPHRAVRVDDRGRPLVPDSEGDLGPSIGARVASVMRSEDPNGLRVQWVRLRGAAAHAIPAYAQLHRAGLLVVERDYGSPRFWRSGRTVDELSRQAPMPLLVLPKKPTGEREERVLRRIVAPVDFTVASAVALRTALELARRYDARVTALHASQDVAGRTVFGGSEAWDVLRRLPGHLAAVAKHLRRKAGAFGAHEVDIEVTNGLADSAILEIASRDDADLIVMGVANRSWLDRVLFGSTLSRVLRRAAVPVLVVPVVAGAHVWPDDRPVDVSRGRAWPRSSPDRAVA